MSRRTLLACRVRNGSMPTRPTMLAVASRLKNFMLGSLNAPAGEISANAKFRLSIAKPIAPEP